MANWATHRLVMLVELVVFVVALSPTPSAADTPVSFGEALQDLGDRLEKAPRFKHLQKSVLDEVLHARQPLTGGESVYGFLRKAWGAERLNRSAVGQPCVEDVNKILAALILSQEEWALRSKLTFQLIRYPRKRKGGGGSFGPRQSIVSIQSRMPLSKYPGCARTNPQLGLKPL